MQIINLTSIKKEFTVEAAQETAFKVFTEKMDLVVATDAPYRQRGND